MDSSVVREARIVYQNALSHATQISIHNAKADGAKIAVEDVIAMAKIIAREVMSLGKEKGN